MQSVTFPPPHATRSSTFGFLSSSRLLRVTLVLLAMWVFLSVHPATREAFFSADNFSNLTAQVAEIIVIGVGMTLVVVLGGIDLSVGASMAVSGVIAAKLEIDMGQPAWIAGLTAIAVSSAFGAWHGLLVSRFSVPPFIATLSGLLSYRGIALVLSDARGLSPMSESFKRLGGSLPASYTLPLALGAFALGTWMVLSRERRRASLALPKTPVVMTILTISAMAIGATFFVTIYRSGAPMPVMCAIAATAMGGVLLTKTRLGRYAVAIGGNAEAARLSGVPVARVQITIYTLTGALAALAGLIATARTNGVTPGNAGLTRELHVITAVVIGGTSLTGGRGTMLGTMVGALIFGTLANGMNLTDVNSDWQLIVTGQILLGASLLDSLTTRKR